MPKRRRLLNTPRKPSTQAKSFNNDTEESPRLDREVRTARGRLMGALLEVLEAESSEDERYIPQRNKKNVSDDEDRNKGRQSPQRQSYVLKLFDRSVDLSQFKEDTPLYPICRAWIANQPKANYSCLGKKMTDLIPTEAEVSIELPKPEGPPVPRIPPLLPEQTATNKDNINLNYREAPPPSREELLSSHLQRWCGVRRAWLEQAARVEARYENTQAILNNKINII